MSSEDLSDLFEALATGDVELCFNDGRSIKAHAVKLKLASMQGILRSLIEDFVEDQIFESIKRRKMDETGQISAYTAILPQIKVEGDYEDWIDVLRLIYHSDLAIGCPSPLPIKKAFKIFPVAHQYSLKTVLGWCTKAIEADKLKLWPSEPIASSEVSHFPGLVQWLALADAKQCDHIVDCCLVQLTASGASNGTPLIREALASPTLNPMMEGLRPETLIKAMRLMVNLPLNKVVVPEVGRITPSFTASQGDEVPVSACLTMSGSLLICPKSDSSAMAWDINTNSQRGVLQWDEDGFNKAIYWAVNATGKKAVSTHYSNTVKIWDLEIHQQKVSIQMSDLYYPCILDSKLLLGSCDGSIEVWDMGSNPPVITVTLEGHTNRVNDIKASDSTSLALSCSDDKTLRLWDLRTSGGCVRFMEGHTDKVWSVDWDLACKTAVSGSLDKTIKQWDLGSGRCVETYQCGSAVAQVIMHESGAFFISRVFTYDSAELQSWAVGCGAPLMTMSLIGSDSVHRVAASLDLSCVALCTYSPAAFKVDVWK